MTQRVEEYRGLAELRREGWSLSKAGGILMAVLQLSHSSIFVSTLRMEQPRSKTGRNK